MNSASQKRWWLLAILLVFVGAIVAFRMKPTGKQGQVVKNGQVAQQGEATNIGVVLSLSGSMAEYGQNGKEGLTLAMEQLRARKDIKPFELLYQDAKDAPQDTVNAVRRLIDVDKAKFIIGGLTSSGVLAAAPYAQQHGVLFFSPAASAPGIPEIGDLVFRNWPSDDAVARQYGAAVRKRGVQSVAILHVSNDYGKTNSEAFSAAFTAGGGHVLLKKAFPQGTTDFKTLITQVAALKNVQKVFVIAYPDEYRAFFQQIALAKLDSHNILTSDTFYSPQTLSDFAPLAEGVICAVAAKPGANYQPRKKFVAAYRARFKKKDGTPKDPGLVSDTAYDALYLVATGISKTDGSPKAVSDWLLHHVKDYTGAAGVTNFTNTGDVKGSLALYQVKSGKFVPVGL
jgi:branched-chain amino acid transport system substrate-binding protein